MSKWKCGICNREFENYHAQGFDNIIYCPLCYYKELYKRDKKEIERLNNIINKARRKLGEHKYYLTPTEEQNKENEIITEEVYQILHENLYELKELKEE